MAQTIPLHTHSPNRTLRLWPGVTAVVLLWLARFGVPAVMPGEMAFAMVGGLVGGLAVLVWWLFFSRASWRERLGSVAVTAVALVVTSRLLHESVATGMMGLMFTFSVIPTLSLGLVAWAVLSRGLTNPLARGVTMAAAILAACGGWALARTDGITGEGNAQLAWRWSATHEERLLQEPAAAVVAVAEAPAAAVVEVKPAAVAAVAPPVVYPAGPWPAFRGAARDGVVHGLRIKTDWTAAPPVELWRREIGPGWSSFAVRGNLVYTQEQRGEQEMVSCYRLGNGKPVWSHGDPARFWESNAGAGPRGTPAVSGSRVFTLGATGIVNALDALSGAVAWKRDALADTGMTVPDWGLASSPLVVDDAVIVAVSGRLAAYDAATGAPRWMSEARGESYSSPQLATIGGVPQLLLMTSKGVASANLADGAWLWTHDWKGFTTLQPALLSDGGGILISTSGAAGGVGTRRLSVTQPAAGAAWTAEERWTSNGLKPYFNDLAVHAGFAFGFDGHILSCIDLETGARKWKGGRYGHGQMVLLAEQDLLLVLSEEGELALVKATPGEFAEVARFTAIEGKTWNHPALAGDVVLVRNGQEMAAFRLARAGS